MTTDNSEATSESPNGLIDAYQRCVELTKGFDRACPEPYHHSIMFLLRVLNSRHGIKISTLFQNLNEIYYQVNFLLEPSMIETEEFLLTLFVTMENPSGMKRKSGMTGGILVLTTHRGFLITASNMFLGNFNRLFSKQSVLLTETFDYSSPVCFLKTYESTNIFGLAISARYAIKTDNSDHSETWYVMPCEGNNYRLLDAILKKRDRIK